MFCRCRGHTRLKEALLYFGKRPPSFKDVGQPTRNSRHELESSATITGGFRLCEMQVSRGRQPLTEKPQLRVTDKK
jgi:hypothetical protein